MYKNKLFIDKYNNVYSLVSIITEEYLLEHSNLLIRDTPHKYYSEIKNIAKSCIYNQNNLSYNLYKNNKLVSFTYGDYLFSIYTSKLFWFNNMKNAFILLSLLKKYCTDVLVKINIDRPYKEAKWYLFDNYFNNTNHNNFITYIKITDTTTQNVNKLLELYGVKLWDNTVMHS